MRTTALALGALALASPAWAQNATAGARLFNNECKSCHLVGAGAKNGFGPDGPQPR